MIEKNLINELSPKGKNFLQIFVRFLKENDYFYNYKKAFENCKLFNKFDMLTLSCNRLTPYIISNTLIWTETAEGLDYWGYANAQFKDLCYHLQKNITLS